MSHIIITLHSDMCAGAGQSLGNRVDTDICTDNYGIPYIPARRIKGCLREAAEKLADFGLQDASDEAIEKLFGGRYGDEGALRINDAKLVGIDEIYGWIENVKKKGTDLEKKAVHPQSISKMYTYRRGQTALKDGVKVDGSLRFINVLKHYDPLDEDKNKELSFIADVYTAGIPEGDKLFSACCKAVRHMGMERNRGLGNVSIEYVLDTDSAQKPIDTGNLQTDKTYILEYRLTNDAPLTLPDCDGLRTSVPARSVIGVLAGRYLKKHEKTSEFDNLFLDGTTVWSDLTPVLNGEISYPVPMMITKLKNAGGKIINRFADNGNLNWKSLKPKTIETGYMAQTDEGYVIADLPIRSVYHNSIKNRETTGDGLYMQDSIDSGYVFAGTVKAPGNLIRIICDLIQQESLCFGRSRSAQYAKCDVTDIKLSEMPETASISTKCGKPLFVILKSDMLLGNIESARKELSELLEFENECPDQFMDLVQFRSIGGYQGMWQLQKPHVQVISAGSVFCFKAKKEAYPAQIQIGKNKQEGFGLCSILSSEEMDRLKSIKSGSADRIADSFSRESAQQKRFVSAVIANECMELVSDNAEKVSKEIRSLRGEKVEGNKRRKGIPAGRLRLLAFEAADYVDLRNKIDQIKESDIDSESIGRRWECHELLDKLYGADRKNISCEAVLGIEAGNDKLDVGAQSIIKANWKKPLDIALHYLQFSKGGKR